MCIFNVSALQQLLHLKPTSLTEKGSVKPLQVPQEVLRLNVLMLLSRPGLLTLQLTLDCEANVVYNHILIHLNVLKVFV